MKKFVNILIIISILAFIPFIVKAEDYRVIGEGNETKKYDTFGNTYELKTSLLINESKVKPGTSNAEQVPQTSDDILIYVGLSIVSLLVVAGIGFYLKKK